MRPEYVTNIRAIEHNRAIKHLADYHIKDPPITYTVVINRTDYVRVMSRYQPRYALREELSNNPPGAD